MKAIYLGLTLAVLILVNGSSGAEVQGDLPEQRETMVSDRMNPNRGPLTRVIWYSFDQDLAKYKSYWANWVKVKKLYNQENPTDQYRRGPGKYWFAYSQYTWGGHGNRARYMAWKNVVAKAYPAMNWEQVDLPLSVAIKAKFHPSVAIAAFLTDPQRYLKNGKKLYALAKKMAANYKNRKNLKQVVL